MGEEKKPAEEEKKVDTAKKPEEGKKEKEKEKEEKASADEKTNGEEKKQEDENKKEENNKEGAVASPPPLEIVVRVYMHCEGCARKVRRCLKGFDGVEDVTTDCKAHKVVVKGEKADPLKVVERLQRKTHRQVELLSPFPKPPAEEEKKPEEKDAPKPEEKKEEPKVITVVLKVHMHCEACSLEIKKRIERMKEVEEVTPDLKNSQVSVKGTFDPPRLVDFIYKRTGKHATIVKQDPPLEKKDDDNVKEGKEKKGDDGGKKGEEKGEKGKEEKKEGGSEGKENAVVGGNDGEEATTGEGAKVVEIKKNEYYYYPPRYAMEMYAYPPQIFSDENPNACSIM